MARNLYRSMRDRMIAGIYGGIAEYFNIDSNIVRIGFVRRGCITSNYYCLDSYF